MAFITLGASSELQIQVPTKGTTDWADTLQTQTFLKIAQHDHTGSGNGAKIGAGALSADAVSGAEIRLDNDEYLRGRNNADTANINIIKVDTSDLITFGTSLNSPVLTTPQINDTSSDHQYVFAVNELAADRTVTLPLLTGNDEFVFKDHAVTLTNKTIASAANTITIDADVSTVSNIKNADIKAAAAIALNKLAATTASRALVSDGSGFVSAATTTATEIGYVNGVTSAIQTQIDGKVSDTGDTMTGALLLDNESALRLGEADGNGTDYLGFKAPAALTTTTTFTLPDGDGSSGQAMVTNGSGTLSWDNPTAAAPADTAKTTTYTATTSDEYIRCDTSSAAFTVTLYAASGNAGKRLTLIKTNSDLDKPLTIDGNASETINGATTFLLYTQYESVTLECDGTNWVVASRYIPSGWTSFTPTGDFTTNTTYSGFWRREGDSVRVQMKLSFSGAPNSTSLDVNMPTNMTIDTAKVSDTGVLQPALGAMAVVKDDNTGNSFFGSVYINTSSTLRVIRFSDVGSGEGIASVTEADPITIAASDTIHLDFLVPVSGWEN